MAAAAAQQAAQAAIEAAASNREPKVADLATTADRTAVENFIMKVEDQFLAARTPEARWVSLACIAIQDHAKAGSWWREQRRIGSQNEPPTRPQTTMTWNDFITGLRAQFTTASDRATLLRAWENNLVCAGTHDIAEYIARVRNALQQLQAASIALPATESIAAKLIRALPESIRNVVNLLDAAIISNHDALIPILLRYDTSQQADDKLAAPVNTQVTVPNAAGVAAISLPENAQLLADLHALAYGRGRGRGRGNTGNFGRGNGRGRGRVLAATPGGANTATTTDATPSAPGITCWNCGGKGHRYEVCPSERQAHLLAFIDAHESGNE